MVASVAPFDARVFGRYVKIVMIKFPLPFCLFTLLISLSRLGCYSGL